MKSFKEFLGNSEIIVDNLVTEVAIPGQGSAHADVIKTQKEATKALYDALDRVDKSMSDIIRQGIMKPSPIPADFIDLRHKLSKWNNTLVDNTIFKR